MVKTIDNRKIRKEQVTIGSPKQTLHQLDPSGSSVMTSVVGIFKPIKKEAKIPTLIINYVIIPRVPDMATGAISLM